MGRIRGILGGMFGLVRDHPAIAATAGLVVLVALYLGVSAALYFGRTDLSTKYAIEFQETASEMPAVRFDDKASIEQAAGSLIAAEVGRRERGPAEGVAQGPGAGLGGGLQADWTEAVWIAVEYLRLASEADSRAYRAWLGSRGRRLFSSPPEYGFFTSEYYKNTLEFVNERVPEVRVDTDDFFDQYYYGCWRLYDGAYRPASLVTEPHAIEVHVQQIEHWSANIENRLRPGGLGGVFWDAANGFMSMTLSAPEYVFAHGDNGDDGTLAIEHELDPARDLQRRFVEPLFDGRSEVLACRVRLVYRSETGLPVPISFNFVANQKGGWVLLDIFVTNVGQHVVGAQPILIHMPQ